jgi:hypothetical protein
MDQIQPVDALVRAGFAQKMTEQFRAQTSWTTSPDKLAALKALRGNTPVEYPYIFLTQQSLSPNHEGYVSHRLARYGVPVMVSDDEKVMHYARIIPQNFEIEVTFITNAYDGNGLNTVDGFARRWHFALRNGFMHYRVNYGLTAVDITAMLNDTLSLPSRENPAETESVYQVVANATIKGYISEPELGSRQRVLEVEADARVATQLPQATGATQFFPFPSA